MKSLLKSLVSLATIVSLLVATTLPAMASLVATEQSVSEFDKANIIELVQRQDVQDQLSRYGVDSQQLEARVNSMTSAELAELNARIDELPAGEFAGQVLSIAFALLIIFLITDIIGATNVFPFVKSLN